MKLVRRCKDGALHVTKHVELFVIEGLEVKSMIGVRMDHSAWITCNMKAGRPVGNFSELYVGNFRIYRNEHLLLIPDTEMTAHMEKILEQYKRTPNIKRMRSFLKSNNIQYKEVQYEE